MLEQTTMGGAYGIVLTVKKQTKKSRFVCAAVLSQKKNWKEIKQKY